MSSWNRERIIADIIHQIAYNGGKVNTRMFIDKAVLLYGRREEKIIEYLKLLEATKRIIVGDYDTELRDKSEVKVIWKPDKKEAEDFSDDPHSNLLDKFVEELE